MAVKPADMESCKEKKKCLGGVNNGLAYDSDDPCPADYTFDPVACDCSQAGCFDTAVQVTVRYTAALYQSNKFGCGQVNCNINCSDRGDFVSCGIVTDTFVVAIGAGKCLKHFGMTRAEYALLSPPICGEEPWGEYYRYAEWYVCDPDADPKLFECGPSDFTLQFVGCEAGFTYDWEIEDVQPI